MGWEKKSRDEGEDRALNERKKKIFRAHLEKGNEKKKPLVRPASLTRCTQTIGMIFRKRGARLRERGGIYK